MVPADSRVTCDVFESFETLNLNRTEWDAAVLALGGSVYMSYDWVRLWWKFYGDRRKLRIFICRADRQVVGILPVYVDAVGGPFQLAVARLVGSNLPPKVFDPAVNPEFAAEVFGVVLDWLVVREHCGVFSFGPVSANYAPGAGLAEAASRRSDVDVSSLASGVHSYWELPSSLDEFYAGLSRNERKNRKADLKKLETEHQVTIRSAREGACVVSQFDKFISQHTTQWARDGRSGHFGSWPNAAEYNRELVAAHGTLGRVRIIRLANDCETVASLYAFAFGKCYYGELPARSVDPRWDKLSLGPATIVATLAAAISEGAARMEGGLGHYDYKLRLNAVEEPVNTLRVYSRRLKDRAALLGLGCLKSSLQPVYQRFWRKMVAPRFLPKSAQRQSRWWVDLDF